MLWSSLFLVRTQYLLVDDCLPTFQDREYVYIKVRLLALEVSSVELWNPVFTTHRFYRLWRLTCTGATCTTREPDSLVSTVFRLWVEVQKYLFDSRQGQEFYLYSKASISVLTPSHLMSKGNRKIFSDGEGVWAWRWRFFFISCWCRERVEPYTFILPYALMACTGTNFLFTRRTRWDGNQKRTAQFWWIKRQADRLLVVLYWLRNLADLPQCFRSCSGSEDAGLCHHGVMSRHWNEVHELPISCNKGLRINSVILCSKVTRRGYDTNSVPLFITDELEVNMFFVCREELHSEWNRSIWFDFQCLLTWNCRFPMLNRSHVTTAWTSRDCMEKTASRNGG